GGRLPPDKIVGCCERNCISHKRLILNMLKIVSNKALVLNKKVNYLTMKTLRQKICNYLLDLNKNSDSENLLLPLSRNEMAEFLNVSRPSLSREMCRLRDEGIIEFHRISVRIINLPLLIKLCE
ncbi:MAG: helix-turn-helix domain-containing protein, partial [Eubacteriales bacterium]